MSTKKKSAVHTLRAQWLGQQMRQLRLRAGLTLAQAAEFLDRDASSLARWERADWPFRRTIVIELLDLYGEHRHSERARFIELAEDAWRTDRWDDDYDELVDASFIDFPWLETRADEMCSFDAMLIPGLMQTPEYAEAVIRYAEGKRATPLSMAKWMQLRLDRQRVLDRDPPVRISSIVDESVLRRVVVDAAVQRAQLRHLTEVARRPNVLVRVLPSRVGLHPGLDGSFWLFRMPKPYPNVAYVERIGGRSFLESPRSDRYAAAYARLGEVALEAADSAKLITTIAEELA